MTRSDALSRFLDTARDTLFALVEAGTPAGDAATRISGALTASTGTIVPSEAEAPPACRHLDAALERARGKASIASLAEALSDLVPELAWRRRPGVEAHGEVFREGHANALIVGPGGLEQRNDVLVGASLVAPGVRYIDHHHPPEEIYIVMSEGEWYREGKGWYVPGAGEPCTTPRMWCTRCARDPRRCWRCGCYGWIRRLRLRLGAASPRPLELR